MEGPELIQELMDKVHMVRKKVKVAKTDKEVMLILDEER